MKNLIVNRKLVNPCNKKITYGWSTRGGGLSNKKFIMSNTRTNRIINSSLFIGFRIIIYKKVLSIEQ